MTSESPLLDREGQQQSDSLTQTEINEQNDVLSSDEIEKFTNAALGVISPGESTVEPASMNEAHSTLSNSMMQNVHGVADELARLHGRINPDLFNQEAQELREQLDSVVNDPERSAVLQKEIIFRYVAVISDAQNGREIGITPNAAREVQGFDCTMSTWSLKDKLQGVPNLDFNFGYPPGHSVAIITLANNQTLYVDAQNGFMSTVSLREITRDGMAYPLYEIEESRMEHGTMPNGEVVSSTREDGCSYVPNIVGVREDGVLHTAGNMFMFANPTSATFFTEQGRVFREKMNIREMPSALHDRVKALLQNVPQGVDENQHLVNTLGPDVQAVKEYRDYCSGQMDRFNDLFVDEIAGGMTVYSDQNKQHFDSYERHHAEWLEGQDRLGELQRIYDIRTDQLGLEN